MPGGMVGIGAAPGALAPPGMAGIPGCAGGRAGPAGRGGCIPGGIVGMFIVLALLASGLVNPLSVRRGARPSFFPRAAAWRVAMMAAPSS